MRSLLIVPIAAGATISGAWNATAEQQQPCSPDNFLKRLANGFTEAAGPAAVAERDFQRAVCEYRNCLAANASNVNACEGLRHIMDASAQGGGPL
jgi:hypothetical protein